MDCLLFLNNFLIFRLPNPPYSNSASFFSIASSVIKLHML